MCIRILSFLDNLDPLTRQMANDCRRIYYIANTLASKVVEFYRISYYCSSTQVRSADIGGLLVCHLQQIQAYDILLPSSTFPCTYNYKYRHCFLLVFSCLNQEEVGSENSLQNTQLFHLSIASFFFSVKTFSLIMCTQ